MSVSGNVRLNPPDSSETLECLGPTSIPFKLRFAPQRQHGRSYVSSIKPMGLPAILKDKFDCCESAETPDAVRSALERVHGMFSRGPRDKYEQPLTSAHVYGWWWDRPYIRTTPTDRQLHHHIRDSPWMKEQLRVLAADASYKRL